MHLCKYAEFHFFRYPICVQRPLYQNIVLFCQIIKLLDKRASEPSADKKKHKMKNDPCRKSLPPGVNRFVEKGPLKPEKNKRASEASDKKVI